MKQDIRIAVWPRKVAREIGRFLRRVGVLRPVGTSPGHGSPGLPVTDHRSRAECEAEIRGFSRQPLISVLLPTYDTPPDLLEKALESVRRQWYSNWELCIVDDCSPSPDVYRRLQRFAAKEPRVKLARRSQNGNISAATNDALALAGGEFVAFLDHDDELTPDALFHVARVLDEKPETDLLYTDMDKIDDRGRRSEPFFKPGWSPEYFRGVMYVGHLLVARRSLVVDVGGCDSRFDGVQDYELMLRLTERTDRIEHLPLILYHWRKIPGSIAADGDAKPKIEILQEQAVQEHLDRSGVPGVARRLGGHRVEVRPRPRDSWPLVSILIPTRDRADLIGRCLASLYQRTDYPAFEVVLGDNETVDPEALAVFQRYPIRRVPLPGAFHFSAFNNLLAEHAAGKFLVLLNNDTEVTDPAWLKQLVFHGERDDVGAVGLRLLYADGTVQHAGVILGPRGTADHVMRGFPGGSDGHAGSLRCTREVSAVTGACLLVRTGLYRRMGGLNELHVRHYEDVDFCLKLRAAGFRNISVGSTEMIHHESQTRGSQYNYTDRILLLDNWEPVIEQGDPYYNPNFDQARCDYTLRVSL